MYLCVLEAFMPSFKRFFDGFRCHVDFAHTGSSTRLAASMWFPVKVFRSAFLSTVRITYPQRWIAPSSNACKWLGLEQSRLQSWQDIGQYCASHW